MGLTVRCGKTDIITHGGDAEEVGWRVGLGPIGLGDRGDAALAN